MTITSVTTRDGARLVVESAGQGADVLLIPGWPQSRYAWRHVAPLLVAAGWRVHLLDPRGFGDSDAPTHGYDLDTASSDVDDVLTALGGTADILAHDVGVWIAHAHATGGSLRARSLTLVDSLIPGVSPFPSGFPDEATNLRTWHFAFNRVVGLPELLVRGREREFLQWFFESKAVQPVFDEGSVSEHARILALPDRLEAGLSYYRELLGADGRERAAQRATVPLDLPILTIGARTGVGSGLHDTLVPVASDLSAVIVDDCGHYVPEEQPAALVDHALNFWSRLH